MNKQNKKAFTLVELIVVITILAILGTIAFVSMQGYSKSSRNSVRISDMKLIGKSLELYQVKTGRYPEPTEAEPITYSGGLAWYQGIFGNSTFRNVEKLNKIPVDPLSGISYSYSLLNTKKEYELSGIIESENIAMLNKANAEKQSAIAILKGNYNGVSLRINTNNQAYILALPSITTSTDLLVEDNRKLENIIPAKQIVLKDYKNLPSSYRKSNYNTDKETTNTNYEIIKDNNVANALIYEGNIKNLTSTVLVEKLQKAYSGTTASNTQVLQEFLELDTKSLNAEEIDKIDKFGVNFINNNLGGSAETKIYNTCNGISHNTTKSFYSETNVGFEELCDSVKKDFICIDGEWKDGNLTADLVTYQYESCSVNGALNCEPNENYLLNGHIYNLPLINHSSSITITTDISENNGLYKYTLNVTCNNGELSSTETGPVLQSCNSGYTSTIDSCELNSLMSNIIGYWDFDEGNGQFVKDKLGNGNDLYVYEDDATDHGSWVNGKIGGGAYQLSGTDARVRTPGLSMTGPAKTINFWFKLPDISDIYGTFVSFENSSDGNKEDNLGQSSEYYGSSVCSGYTNQFRYDMPVNDSNWHFYSISKGTDTIVCIDGICEFTGVDSTSGITTPTTITLNGGIGCGFAQFSQGLIIDELRMHSKSFTKKELEQIYIDSGGSAISITDYNGAKRYSNGTYADNCKSYLDSTAYNNNGDGVYWVKIDANPAFKVYCDMTTDGGGWTLVGENYDGGMNVSEAVSTINTNPDGLEEWKLSDTQINKLKSSTSSTINGFRITYDGLQNTYFWSAACLFNASELATTNYCNDWSVNYDQVGTYDGGDSGWYGLARRIGSRGNNGWSIPNDNYMYPCYTLAYSNGECTKRYSSSTSSRITNPGTNLWVK